MKSVPQKKPLTSFFGLLFLSFSSTQLNGHKMHREHYVREAGTTWERMLMGISNVLIHQLDQFFTKKISNFLFQRDFCNKE